MLQFTLGNSQGVRTTDYVRNQRSLQDVQFMSTFAGAPHNKSDDLGARKIETERERDTILMQA